MLIVLVTVLSACSGPGYYLQAASGHWKLMRSRQDVSGIIADPAADPGLVRRLETAQAIVRFANNNLGLPSSGSYSDYVATGRDAVTWNVVATPEFSMAPKRWCFAVAGCVPYRGFFEQSAARKSASRLAATGMDTAVSPVAAYSTLGWFRDPLLDTMLAHSDLQLAATLIHELAHQRLYLKGAAEFSEAYARFVERAGVEAWLRATERSHDIEQWLSAQRATGQFNRLLLATRDKLADIYASEIPETDMRAAKQKAFEALREDYRTLVDHEWRGHDRFAGWFSSGINNAHLALVQAYEGAGCAFASLFMEANEDFEEFHRLAAEQARLDKARLDAWLAQSCDAVAPGGDL